MNKTLILKEFHDLRYVLAIAGLAIFILVTSLFGFTPTGKIMDLLGHDTGIEREIFTGTELGAQPPFSPNGYIKPVTLVTFVLALILGFTQGLHDSRSGRWQFLMSQPVTQMDIVQSKILVGLGVWFITLFILVGSGLLYSGIPGMVPYPLEGWVVLRGCQWLTLGAPIYMVSLYCAYRKARWLGTRLFPLIGGYILFAVLSEVIFYIYTNFIYYNHFTVRDKTEFISLTSIPFSFFTFTIIYLQIRHESI